MSCRTRTCTRAQPGRSEPDEQGEDEPAEATEIGLQFTPLADGLARTVAWLRTTGKLPATSA